MARYTAAVTISFGSESHYRNLIPDSGTSVTIEVYSGSEFVAIDESPITTPQQLYTRNTRVRLTPDVGGFSIDDSIGDL